MITNKTLTHPFKALILLLIILTSRPGYTSEPELSGSPLNLTLIHMNDTHSHLEGSLDLPLTLEGQALVSDTGGYPRFITRIMKARETDPDTLVLHAGDAVQGSLYFTKYKGEADMALLNLMNLDAMVLGNHEFDKGPEFLSSLVKKANFPILSANLDASSEPLLNGLFQPFIIKTIAKERIAILGITTPATRSISSPGPRVRFKDTINTVNAWVSQFTTMGINKIIVLSHQGYDMDKQLAETVDGLDLIVGGHSHTLLGGQALETLGKTVEGPYPTTVTNKKGNPCYVAQAGAYALFIGILEMTFDRHGVIRSISGTPILLTEDQFRKKEKDNHFEALDPDSSRKINTFITVNPAIETIKEDSHALAVLKPYRDGIQEMLTQSITKVPKTLIHTRLPKGLYVNGIKLSGKGSDVLPLVCRSMLWKMKTMGLSADIALQNSGGIRKSLSAGGLTAGDIHELMPFENTLVLVEISGEEFFLLMADALDRAVHGGGGAFPGLFGARIILDSGKHSKKPSLKSIELPDGAAGWKALDKTATYTLVTNSYLAGGGNQYNRLAHIINNKYDTGLKDAEVFMEWAMTRPALEKPEKDWVIILP